MNSSCAKTVLAPLVLAATWATAHADATLTTTFTSTAAIGTVDHVRLFSEDYTNPGFPLVGTLIPGTATVSGDLGPSAPTATVNGTTAVAYAAGTSAYAGFVGTVGTNAIVLAGNSFFDSPANASTYLSSGTNFGDVFAAIVNGDSAPLLALYTNQDSFGSSGHGISLGNFDPGSSATLSLSSYVFTQASTGAVTSSGLFSNTGTLQVTPINPTPEPASMAALGAGALALIRRRRKLA